MTGLQPENVDLARLRVELQAMSGAELLAYGYEMHRMAYPHTYDFHG